MWKHANLFKQSINALVQCAGNHMHPGALAKWQMMAHPWISNRRVPRTRSSSSWDLPPHELPNSICTGWTAQHIFLHPKKTHLSMALFSWRIEGIKRIQSLSGHDCLPRSHQALNLMMNGESESLDIKFLKFWINTELWSQGQKVDCRVKFKLLYSTYT